MSIAFIIDDRFQLKQDWLKIVEYQRLKFEAAEEYILCDSSNSIIRKT